MRAAPAVYIRSCLNASIQSRRLPGGQLIEESDVVRRLFFGIWEVYIWSLLFKRNSRCLH